ncbi:hypothetical protein P692DRAFT_20825305 [Suillus brevipes Sb2]|nr:hypothetical protein P692DRAFT_20825305 [Suillus brevipes Sb2]
MNFRLVTQASYTLTFDSPSQLAYSFLSHPQSFDTRLSPFPIPEDLHSYESFRTH